MPGAGSGMSSRIQHRFDNFTIQLLGSGGMGGRLYAPAYVPERKPGLITGFL
jgi:hypothetical protein